MKSKDELLIKTMNFLQPPKPMSTAEWADNFRVISAGNAEPGRWKSARIPYCIEILNAFTQAGIKRVVVKSAAQIGKALWIYTFIPTPNGFALMKDLKAGDEVFDENGDICKIIAATEIMYDRPCYELTFSDGAKIIADANHNWQLLDGKSTCLLTTEQIFQSYKAHMYAVSANPFNERERLIMQVQQVESVPVKCIQVDSASHMYLCGENFIPTHNSEILLNVIGRMATLDPCPILIIQPTLEMAGDFSKNRLMPMIRDTKILTELFDKERAKNSNQTILSKNFRGGRLVLAGANSPAGLASRPIRLLLCDEVDRFPQSAGGEKGGEGDPLDLATKRQSTYWNAITGIFSTPTNEGASRIDVEYAAGTQEIWVHKCPNCGEFHSLDYRDMQAEYIEQKDDVGNKSVVVKSVKWRCPDCGVDFDERTIKNSPQRYIVQNPDALKNGVRSFWLNGFSSPWLSWAEIMREWLEAQGMPTREAVVYNTRFGLSYKLQGEYEDEREFVDSREIYGAELPDGVLLLTAAVDVQKNRLEYEIAGWSADESRYGILRGLVQGEPTDNGTWRELDKVLDREFRFADGKRLKVSRTFIDSGYATRSVYEYCALNVHKQRFPIKGRGGAGLPLLYQYTKIKNLPQPLTILGVDDGKQEIFARLGIRQGAQSMHFPRDDEMRRGYDRLYFKQLIAERRVYRRKGGVAQLIWTPIADNVRNEALDMAVYGLACLKSCIGNGGGDFWKRRYDLINQPAQVEKVKKTATYSRNLDIWTA